MAFFECEFPRQVSFLALGGPVFSTTVNEGFSGGEQRNRNWSATRGQWTIDLHYKPQSYFDAAQAFFYNVGGQADAFRFKDHKDYSASGQLLGYGDGNTTTFQLVKNYSSAGRTYTRTIVKPIMSTISDFQGNALSDTVVIYVNGTVQTYGTAWTIDATTGIVTFATAPAAGSPPNAVTADFEFHYPVRFKDDALAAQVEESDVPDGDTLITWPQFELREVKIATTAPPEPIS
jgi:uncharacterized protein (TIGR02217 family)